MRIKKQQEIVRQITTGHVEADMLGNVYLWLSERANRKYPQRPHRTYKRKSNIRVAVEWFQTAPSACWRSLTKGISNLRKHFRNGN